MPRAMPRRDVSRQRYAAPLLNDFRYMLLPHAAAMMPFRCVAIAAIVHAVAILLIRR